MHNLLSEKVTTSGLDMIAGKPIAQEASPECHARTCQRFEYSIGFPYRFIGTAYLHDDCMRHVRRQSKIGTIPFQIEYHIVIAAHHVGQSRLIRPHTGRIPSFAISLRQSMQLSALKLVLPVEQAAGGR